MQEPTEQILFRDLAIHPQLQEGIVAAGFECCTPIQALALPIALKSKDVCGQAQTGTGKTAAFLIACIHHLLQKEKPTEERAISALILAPTRELAQQIFQDAEPLVKQTDVRLGLAYGGADYDKQRDHIAKGVDILVGTPGRTIDFYKQKVFHMKSLQCVILDEADRMFDLGFLKDIRFLLRQMPEASERLNLLFSATLSFRVSELAYEYLNMPETVKVEAEKITASKVKELAYMPSNTDKIPLLLNMVHSIGEQKAVIFSNTKITAEHVYQCLRANNFNASLLSGDVPQKKRDTLIQGFKAGSIQILVATDVAARGLHIPLVKYVINFDLPDDAEDYVHRVGRTARAGHSGTAISFICETYAMNMMDIEHLIEHKLPIEAEYHSLLTQEWKQAPKPSGYSKKHHQTRQTPHLKNKPSSFSASKTNHKPRQAQKDITQQTVTPKSMLTPTIRKKEVPAVG